MRIRPMIGTWSPPSITRIRASESRRLVTLEVPGLSGDLHQDLGRAALQIEIEGSLSGDDLRDEFLKEVRERYLAGEPVDFVADIAKESELEQVWIEALAFEESADAPDVFFYRLVLREYTEPPEPPAMGGDLGAGLEAELDDLAALGLEALDLPAVVAGLPAIDDVIAPIKPGADALKSALGGLGGILSPINSLFGGS
ncbi:MAG: hypothetical protein IT360_23595 [Gemmatimonadaceae bacterium]|nr:hypothetical protein [Gemmatimonadaceae bacterium]